MMMMMVMVMVVMMMMMMMMNDDGAPVSQCVTVPSGCSRWGDDRTEPRDLLRVLSGILEWMECDFHAMASVCVSVNVRVLCYMQGSSG